MILLFTFNFKMEDLFWAVICQDKVQGLYFYGPLEEGVFKGNYQSLIGKRTIDVEKVLGLWTKIMKKK